MTNFEQTLLREISSLPAARSADVLAFVRFLKLSLVGDDTAEQEFDQAIRDARKTAKKYKITPDVIEAEIKTLEKRSWIC
jgi:hypothetical protein